MSTNTALERVTLKEKLLEILKNNNISSIINEIEFYMYIYDLDNELSEFKDKGKVLIDKIKQLIGERIADLMMYSVTEWAAAYIIAYEYQKIEELNRTYQTNITKYKCNYELYDTIKKTIYELNSLIDKFVKQIRETRDENTYNIMVEKIEQVNSIIKYLVDFMDNIEKENNKLIEISTNARQNLYKTIREILENL
jgi:hypothetical protein